MSHAATQAAILAGKYHGNGLYYEKHITPMCDADKREKALAADRAIKAARFRARPRTVVVANRPEEVAALGEP